METRRSQQIAHLYDSQAPTLKQCWLLVPPRHNGMHISNLSDTARWLKQLPSALPGLALRHLLLVKYALQHGPLTEVHTI
jgi:hypothetical protein